jgi:hypothetical protein
VKRRNDVRAVAALAYGLSAVPYHLAYFTVTSAVVAACVATAIALALLLLLRSNGLWQYGAALAVAGLPLAYFTGIGTVLVGLVVVAVGAYQSRRQSSPA